MGLVLSLKPTREIDENRLAVEVTRREGKKIELPIGQVKEVQKIVLDLLAEHWQVNPRGVGRLLRKHRSEASR